MVYIDVLLFEQVGKNNFESNFDYQNKNKGTA